MAQGVQCASYGGKGETVVCRENRGRGRSIPSTALLDFGHVELEEAVQPCDEFLAVGVVSHVSNYGPVTTEICCI